MEKKLVSNYIYNILFQLIKIIAPLIVVPCTMGNLGPSVLGISDFANNIASWFVLFGVLGINTYGQREIAKVRDNPDERSKTFFEILSTQVFNLLVVLIIYTLYVTICIKENKLIFYLYCISIFSSALDVTWLYFGMEEFKIVSIRNIIIKLLGVSLILLIIKQPSDLWKFVVINTCSDVFGHIITYTNLPKYISFKKINFKEAYVKHIKATLILFIPTIAINVYTLLDQTMLGILVEDKSPVALYKTAQNFVKIFLYFITSIGSVMMPRIANVYYNKKDMNEVNKYLNTTYNLAIMFAFPMIMAMLTVTPFFIPWYLPEQLEIIELIQISSPIILFISISNVFGIQYLVPTGHNKEYTISVICGAAINFFANCLLIPVLGGVGAAIGSVIAELTVTLVQFRFVKNDIKITAMLNTIKFILSSIIMGIVVIFVGRFMGASIVTNIVQAVVGMIVYFICLVILRVDIVKKFLRKENA